MHFWRGHQILRPGYDWFAASEETLRAHIREVEARVAAPRPSSRDILPPVNAEHA